MKNLNEHPTVRRYHQQNGSTTTQSPRAKLNSKELRELCIASGADDVGFVEITRPALADQKQGILNVFPWTKTLISLVGRLNRENLRSPARSIASIEVHHATDRLESAAHALAEALERMNVLAVTPPVGFPMETDGWPGKMYLVSHKPVAVAAGLGAMGLHRSVIHPVFGSSVLLDTVLIDAELDGYDGPLDYDPCLNCKLCAAACPTGAIEPDGSYNPVNCMTHSYRELVGGFSDWVEGIADSRNAREYRRRTSDVETVSMWQSLAQGPCYKSATCLAVCPAGDEAIPKYLEGKKEYVDSVVRPLQKKAEPVYVLPGSDAERHVERAFPEKTIRRVGNGVRPPSIAAFLSSMPFAFQRHQSEGLNATYHFTFTGEEPTAATVRISNKTLDVKMGHEGKADVRIEADSRTWLSVLHKDSRIVPQIILRRIKVKGPMGLFQAFGKCFP